ncbi:MAG TPA: sodium-dependent transporter, partial [Sphingomonadales bacterium]|nr:sodium-dependent transporter [Sphingomonadales bacterium]
YSTAHLLRQQGDSMAKTGVHEQWSSRLAFIFAATGSAVGLGNIWRFPYLAGENGGGAFVIVYILCVILIGIPVLMAELAIGRRGAMSPTQTLVKVAAESGAAPHWKWIGTIASFFGSLMLLSYYSVIAGWVLAYIIKAGSGMFADFWAGLGPVASVSPELAVAAVREQSHAVRDAMFADAPMMSFWHFVFIGFTVYIVGKGINAGLERAVTFMMPVLFLLLLVLVGYAMATGEFAHAVSYLFAPDFSKVTGETVLAAVGQAFFSLSLGLGTMLAYGAYMQKSINLTQSAFIIGASDTAVSLMAGLAIFPLVFAYGLAPDSGPSLIFETLPIAFGNMPGGALFGTLFFILLTIAAITSSISMLEPAVSYLEEKQGFNRWKAAILAGGGTFVIGLTSVFSYNEWQTFYPLAVLGFEGNTMTFFDIADAIVSKFVMPITSVALAVFAGWVVKRALLRQEMALPEGGVFEIWHVLIKYFCPIALIVILISGLT